jgi:outer membrane protein assembly factor BamA
MRRVLGLALAVMAVTAEASGQDRPGGPQTTPTGEAAPPDTDEGFVDKARKFARDSPLLRRIFGDEEGVYLRFGGMTTGSGVALGPGYRRQYGNDRLFVDLSAALSTKLYKSVDANVRWLQLFDERVEAWSSFRYADFPEEDFFGIGPSSSLDMRTNYDIDSIDVGTRALVHVTPWLEVGGTVGFYTPSIDSGADDNYPSIEEYFTDTTAPGLAEQPDYVSTAVYADIDYRDRRGSPTRGGRYRVSFGTWNDVTLDDYDFHRLDADLAQYVSLYPRHVIGVHVGLSYVNNEAGHRVPFYFLPSVGGSDTVRGFREFRFRDENMLFGNLEYRYQAFPMIDVALFADAGEVRPDWEDIGPGDLKTSFGFGVRLHSNSRTFVRLDFGFGGSEGSRVFFKLFSPSF